MEMDNWKDSEERCSECGELWNSEHHIGDECVNVRGEYNKL